MKDNNREREKGKGKGKGKDVGVTGEFQANNNEACKSSGQGVGLAADVVDDKVPTGTKPVGGNRAREVLLDAQAKPRPADWGCTEILYGMTALEKHVVSNADAPARTIADLEEGLSYLMGHSAQITVVIRTSFGVIVHILASPCA